MAKVRDAVDKILTFVIYLILWVLAFGTVAGLTVWIG